MFIDPNGLLIIIFGLAIILGIVGAILVTVVNTVFSRAWNSWETAIRRSIKKITK